MQSETNIPGAPAGFATVNPFIITHEANGLIDFLKQVFRATERPEARTLDHDGLLLHAELAIGTATIMFGERKPGWPFTPSLLQVYVDDVETTLSVARQLGATVVTEPTDFFGDTFSRFRDPWSNLWWVYRHGGQTWAGDEERGLDRRCLCNWHRGVGADLARTDVHPRHPDDGDATAPGPSAGNALKPIHRLEAGCALHDTPSQRR